MERLADENKGRGKECFWSDRLISRKRTVDDHENLDLELRLGPPLNGNSGAEYSKKPKILNCANSDDENNNKNGINEFQFSLISPSSSLPLETEEEGEEREELQSRKHLEEMRKRWEKMKNIIRVDKKNDQNGSGSSGVPVFETRQQPLNQGATVGRLGSGLSMVLVQKLIGAAIERSNNEKLSPVLLSSSYNIAKARWMLLRNFMLIKMPRVWTRGDGPNGEKTDGFLYSCRNIEDVKIVCVCHGYVLSPAEFVKHAGGGDVENPLRHIVVNTLPMW